MEAGAKVQIFGLCNTLPTSCSRLVVLATGRAEKREKTVPPPSFHASRRLVGSADARAQVLVQARARGVDLVCVDVHPAVKTQVIEWYTLR